MIKKSEVIPYIGVSAMFFTDLINEMEENTKEKIIPLINDYYSQGELISYPIKSEKFNMMANLTSFISNNYLIHSLNCKRIDDVKSARLLMLDFLKLERELLHKKLLLPESYKDSVINIFINERKEYNSRFFKKIINKLNSENKNREYLEWLNNL